MFGLAGCFASSAAKRTAGMTNISEAMALMVRTAFIRLPRTQGLGVSQGARNRDWIAYSESQ